jgi:hypothetical protein
MNKVDSKLMETRITTANRQLILVRILFLMRISAYLLPSPGHFPRLLFIGFCYIRGIYSQNPMAMFRQPCNPSKMRWRLFGSRRGSQEKRAAEAQKEPIAALFRGLLDDLCRRINPDEDKACSSRPRYAGTTLGSRKRAKAINAPKGCFPARRGSQRSCAKSAALPA